MNRTAHARIGLVAAFTLVVAMLAMFLPGQEARAEVPEPMPSSITYGPTVSSSMMETRTLLRLEERDHRVKRLRVTYAERVSKGRLFYELNNGSAWVTRPCEYEDTRNCWWDAGNSGNGIGDSFVNFYGRYLYLDGVRVR